MEPLYTPVSVSYTLSVEAPESEARFNYIRFRLSLPWVEPRGPSSAAPHLLVINSLSPTSPQLRSLAQSFSPRLFSPPLQLAPFSPGTNRIYIRRTSLPAAFAPPPPALQAPAGPAAQRSTVALVLETQPGQASSSPAANPLTPLASHWFTRLQPDSIPRFGSCLVASSALAAHPIDALSTQVLDPTASQVINAPVTSQKEPAADGGVGADRSQSGLDTLEPPALHRGLSGTNHYLGALLKY
ncbi:Hypothetical protein TPAR_09141 [Tolypocladium paradoxum]|uniref:Uncharacterized protein n=1 Tax=Tolypocladium paradoxum TaxID=94208 RepID=A0A2S4L2D1_9HYPO|nr:Hypothetical protein TPAR_09141 [Tolypocladium paradoxum]